MAMVITICKALDGLLKDKVVNLEYTFVYACIWAIGAAFSEKDGDDYRKVFSSWWRGQTEWKVVKFPAKGTIFDFYIDQSGDNAKPEEWVKIVKTIEYDDVTPMQNITVPTPETVSASQYIKNLILVGHPSLLVGMAGSGKTQLLKGLL